VYSLPQGWLPSGNVPHDQAKETRSTIDAYTCGTSDQSFLSTSPQSVGSVVAAVDGAAATSRRTPDGARKREKARSFTKQEIQALLEI
jgi:hypothetical protein